MGIISHTGFHCTSTPVLGALFEVHFKQSTNLH